MDCQGFNSVYSFVESLQSQTSVGNTTDAFLEKLSKLSRRSQTYEYLSCHDKSRRENEKRSGVWYKYHNGRAVSDKKSLIYFANAMGVHGQWGLNHNFWQWLDGATSSDEGILKLPEKVKSVFLKSEGTKRKPTLCFKRFQRQQLDNLYKQLSINALMALVILRIIQSTRLSRQQLELIDQHAYALYLFLFEYKYTLNKRYQLGQKIYTRFYLKNGTSISADPTYRLKHDLVLVNKLKGVTKKEKRADIEEQISQQILTQVQNQPHHPNFKVFQ